MHTVPSRAFALVAQAGSGSLSPRMGTLATGLILLLGLVPPVAPAIGDAQEIVQDISNGPWTVVSSQRMEIGERDGRAYVDSPFYVAQTPGGGFLVTVFSRPGEMLVLDEEGELVDVIGRTGQGPGEFFNLGYAKVDDDHAYLLDQRQRRVTVLELDGFAVARAFQLPESPFDLLPLPTGRIVLAMDVQTPEHAGHPYHLLDRDGSFLRSFGGDGGVYRRDRSHLLRRRLALGSTAGRFWGAERTRYRLSLMDESGSLLSTLERRVSWFQPHERGLIADPAEPPRPRISHVHTDSRGRLWVLIQVAAERWVDGLVERTLPTGRRLWTVGDEDRLLDSVIEVIDPAQAVVVARGRFDPSFRQFAGDGVVVSYKEDAEGIPLIQVWDLEIVEH